MKLESQLGCSRLARAHLGPFLPEMSSFVLAHKNLILSRVPSWESYFNFNIECIPVRIITCCSSIISDNLLISIFIKYRPLLCVKMFVFKFLAFPISTLITCINVPCSCVREPVINYFFHLSLDGFDSIKNDVNALIILWLVLFGKCLIILPLIILILIPCCYGKAG